MSPRYRVYAASFFCCQAQHGCCLKVIAVIISFCATCSNLAINIHINRLPCNFPWRIFRSNGAMMSCCFRKAGSSKSTNSTAAANPVLQRILSCQSGRWHNASAPCPTFEQALHEIKEGRKTSHWMWYIWPSLAGVRTTKFPDLMIPNLQVSLFGCSHQSGGD